MTCIVGMIDRVSNKVIIGGDSAGSSENFIEVRKDAKVFCNNEFIIGGTSSFRMIQLLRYSFNPPEVNGQDIFEYMCTDFVSEIQKCFEKGGFLQKGETAEYTGWSFLVGYKDRLFKIQDDFQVSENYIGFDSVGCGSDFAFGSMYAQKNLDIPTEQIVLNALEASEFFALGVRRPFVIESTL